MKPDARAKCAEKLEKLQLELSVWQSRGAPLDQNSTAPLTKSVTLDMLRSHFDKSISEAAKAIGASKDTVRVACRRHGVTRWPYRRLLALRTRIEEVEDAARNAMEPDARTKCAEKLKKLQLELSAWQANGNPLGLASSPSADVEPASPEPTPPNSPAWAIGRSGIIHQAMHALPCEPSLPSLPNRHHPGPQDLEQFR